MTTAIEEHPANQVHRTYLADAKRRELLLAFEAGGGVFRADGMGEKRWVKPTGSEYNDAAEAGWQRGCARFDDRVRGRFTSNVLADSLRTAATAAFDRVLSSAGWHPTIEERIAGDGGGLAGDGRSLLEIHESIMPSKLFAGAEWVRLTKIDGRVLWVQERADDVTDWTVVPTATGVALTRAVVQGVTDEGLIMRRVYEVTKDGVSWVEYVSEKAADFAWIHYAPRTLDDMILEFQPVNKGVYAGLGEVPMDVYRVSWGTPYRSPAPFTDAADVQFSSDELRSHVDEYSKRASASVAFIVQNAKPDTNGQPPRIIATASGAVLPPGATGGWEYLDSQHVPQQLALVESLESLVRHKCMNPMRQTVGAAEVKAAEVNKHDRRTMAWLELCVAADLAPSRRLLGLTAQMEGLPSIESEPTLSYTKTLSDDERDAVTTRFQAWANDGLVSRESFLVVAADVEGDLPAETWEAIKRIEKPLVEAWTTASTRVLHAPGEEPPVDDAAPEADEEPAEVDNDTEE